jgi:hypothetical protein
MAIREEEGPSREAKVTERVSEQQARPAEIPPPQENIPPWIFVTYALKRRLREEACESHDPHRRAILLAVVPKCLPFDDAKDIIDNECDLMKAYQRVYGPLKI